MKNQNWFSVDKEGLAKLLGPRGAPAVVLELISNALDEDGVTRVTVGLGQSFRGYAELSVEDDSPTGFADLSHAWTLFAESRKKADAQKRGRFNLGEKLVLALCRQATLATTTGAVSFDENGVRRSSPAKARETGSRFWGQIKMNHDDVERTKQIVRSLIMDSKNVRLEFNGELLPVYSEAIAEFEAVLPTVSVDDTGTMRDAYRNGRVKLYEPRFDEKPTIYEMGIPVVEHEIGPYHINVFQKLKLNMDRDNVTPGFRSCVAAYVLNTISKKLDVVQAQEPWVTEAAGDWNVRPEALKDVFLKRYGDRAVVFDPSDPESNNRAVADGYTVVHGGSLPRAAWIQVKRHAVLKPAGQVTPSPRQEFHPEGRPPISPEAYSPEQAQTVRYVQDLGEALLGQAIRVTVYDRLSRSSACWSDLHIKLNWAEVEKMNDEKLDALLIHEFGHHYSENHLSDEFHEALCTLGAKLRNALVRRWSS